MTLGQLASGERNALVGGPFGSNLTTRDFAPHGVPVIQGRNMGLRWVSGAFMYVTPTKADSLRANLARPGDVIFTQRGTLGQVSLVPGDAHPAYVVSQSQMKLSPDPSIADSMFIYYYFSSEEQQSYMSANAIRTGVPHTNLGILRSAPVWLPPLREQQSIARFLGALDDKIELNRRISETLEGIARALFKSWFVDFEPVRDTPEWADGRLRDNVIAHFPELLIDSEAGELPDGWTIRPVGELASVVGGTTPKTDQPEYWVSGTHHFATPKDLASLQTPVLLDTARRITGAGLSRIGSGLLPPGTVLLSSRAPIGYLAVTEVPVAINQGFIAMIPKPGISNLFLLHWARHSHDVIVSHANGSTFLEISKANFRPLPVVTPPQPVLRAFDDLAQPLHARMVACERESLTLAALRDALLPKLISGELRVPEAERVAVEAGV